MKKLIFGLIAVVMFSNVGNAQTARETSLNEVSKIHIEFGRVSKSCGGFGICKFTIDLTVDELIDIIGAFRTNDDGINLSFSNDFYKKHYEIFKSGYLIVDEDFTIDMKTSLKLGFKDTKTIKTGKYTVKLNPKTNTYNCYIN